jgi:predicted PurR-regulated permease PerM
VEDIPPSVRVRIKSVLVVCFTVLAVAAMAWLVYQSRFVLAVMLFAAMVAAAINQPVDWLVKRGFKRGAAIALIMGGLLLGVAGLGFAVAGPMVGQAKDLIDRAPQLAESVRHTRVWQRLDRNGLLERAVEAAKSRMKNDAPSAVAPALKLLGGVAALATALVTGFFFVLFMLLYGGPIVDRLLAEALPHRRVRYQQLIGRVYRVIGGYISGLGVLVLVNATCATLFLTILKVPYPLALGVLSGLCSVIPLVGSAAAGVLMTGIALATGGPAVGIGTGIYYVAYQEVENRVFAPLVYKRSVKVNPLVTMTAMLVMAEAFGVIGAVVAVPIAAAGQVVLGELLLLRRERMHSPMVGPARPPRRKQRDEESRAPAH